MSHQQYRANRAAHCQYLYTTAAAVWGSTDFPAISSDHLSFRTPALRYLAESAAKRYIHKLFSNIQSKVALAIASTKSFQPLLRIRVNNPSLFKFLQLCALDINRAPAAKKESLWQAEFIKDTLGIRPVTAHTQLEIANFWFHTAGASLIASVVSASSKAKKP